MAIAPELARARSPVIETSLGNLKLEQLARQMNHGHPLQIDSSSPLKPKPNLAEIPARPARERVQSKRH
jgi:hypothetical protein